MTTGGVAVIMPQSEIRDSVGITPNARQLIVKISNQKFVVYWDGTAAQAATAFSLIKSGMTAGVMPHQTLRPDAIFFDMDATVIAEESLVEIAKVAGKELEISQLTQQAMAGGMDFATSLRMRLSILKGLKREAVMGVKHTLNPGMNELATVCTENSIPMFLVSGGFVDLAEPIARSLGFKDFAANRFLWQGDELAGDIEGALIDGEGKLAAVRNWCRRYKFRSAHCIAVGDGANDLQMMNFCGASVGIKPKATLWPYLKMSNHVGDHRLLAEIIKKTAPS